MSILKKLFIIFFFALLIKAALIFLWRVSNPLETFEYEKIADSILNGKGFLYYWYNDIPYYAFVQPLYPVFTAVVYFLTNHNRIILAILQSVLSSSLVFVVYGLAVRVGSMKAGLLAAFITAFHPGLIIYSTVKLHPLVLDVFLYLMVVYIIVRCVESPTKKLSVLTGCVIGLTLLSRITILPFIIFALGYIFFMLKDRTYKIRLICLGIICVSAFLVYSPWVLRNYQVFHKLVFMQTCSGENLWAGNNTNISGSVILESGASVHTMMKADMRDQLSRLNELQQVDFYQRYFICFVRENPKLFVKLFFKKMYYYWWFSPYTGVLYKKIWLHIYKIYYAILVVFAIVGLRHAFRDEQKKPIVILFIVYMLSISVIHAVVNVGIRHRWTAEPFMIIFASIGFLQLITEFIRYVELKNINIKKA